MGLFLSFLLFSTKNKKIVPVACFVLAFTLILFQYVLYWTGYQFTYPYFIYLPPVCYYLTGPLLYWYFYNLYQKRQPKTLVLHFIPASLCFIPYIFSVLKFSNVYSGAIPLSMLPQYFQPIVIHMSLYVLLLFRFVYKKPSDGLEFQSIRRKWGLLLITLYSSFIVAYLSYYILVNFDFFNAEWDYAISIVMTGAIYTIGYFIFKQPKVFDGEFYAKLFLPKTNTSESLEHQLLEALYAKITTHMEHKKPYINNDLRLANLADQLGFSTHLLSKVINQKSGDNFNTYINKYRLQAAEKILENEQNTPIKTVYYDVGFNSKAAFYTAFKQKHQCTPMQYRQQFKLS